jgi:hypothetical protein
MPRACDLDGDVLPVALEVWRHGCLHDGEQVTVFKAGLPKPAPQKKEKSPTLKTENQLAA